MTSEPELTQEQAEAIRAAEPEAPWCVIMDGKGDEYLAIDRGTADDGISRAYQVYGRIKAFSTEPFVLQNRKEPKSK